MSKFILNQTGTTLVNADISTYIRPCIWKDSNKTEYYELYIHHGEQEFQLATYDSKEDMITEFHNIIDWLNNGKSVYKCKSNFSSSNFSTDASIIDWTIIKPDTLVWVRNTDNSKWHLRYFSHYDEENKCCMCFCGGATSKTAECPTPWKFVKIWREGDTNGE